MDGQALDLCVSGVTRKELTRHMPIDWKFCGEFPASSPRRRARAKVGGSAWESNPARPHKCGRRPILKTGRATGPHSLPLTELCRFWVRGSSFEVQVRGSRFKFSVPGSSSEFRLQIRDLPNLERRTGTTNREPEPRTKNHEPRTDVITTISQIRRYLRASRTRPPRRNGATERR